MAMNKAFTGWQWLLIDAANQYGLDKKEFEDRISWTECHLQHLESLADSAETKPLYLKAVMAIRKAQKGQPTGHMVGVDAVCSGIQIMSVLTGCEAGASATGLVDPNVRSDAYRAVTDEMNVVLGGTVNVTRPDAKKATMTSFYGSKMQPKNIFGADTPELDAFYEAAQKVAPGAWDLLQTLLASWKPHALFHAWKLPDGYDSRVKVMTKQESRIDVETLGSSFTYQYYENTGAKKGLSNAANLTHSVDAYVLRSMHRRCNYDLEMATDAATLIEIELIQRTMSRMVGEGILPPKVRYYMDQYDRSSMADIVILPYLDDYSVKCLSTEHLRGLARILSGMLEYFPFEIVTVHDEFKCHANNVNHMRSQYREILAEIADSNVLDDLLSQLHGTPGIFPKLSNTLGAKIRNSEYALC